MLAHPDAVREVFTGDPDKLLAGEGNEILAPLLGPRSVLLLDGPEHLRERRLLLPPFHGERMQRYGELMREVAEREIATWPAGTAFPLAPRMQAVTLEIILRTVFGLQDGPRLEGLRTALRELLELVAAPKAFATVVTLGPERAVRLPAFRRVLGPVDRLIGEEIRARRGATDLAERDDILSLLLQATDQAGEPMGDAELRDELVTLLIAGHETTATALSWAVERLLRTPGAMERLRDEEGAEYAQAVCHETLRLRPVLPLVLRRLTEPMTIAGHDLPAGVKVAPCITLVHRRADLYPDPHVFRPERFLGVSPAPMSGSRSAAGCGAPWVRPSRSSRCRRCSAPSPRARSCVRPIRRRSTRGVARSPSRPTAAPRSCSRRPDVRAGGGRRAAAEDGMTALQPVLAGMVAAFVGFSSTFAVVLAGLRSVGATPEQAASGLLAVCVVMGVATIALSVRTRMPILLAWSTPGAALLVSAGPPDGGYPAAVGAFVACGALLALTGLWGALGRAIARIPVPIASAMLAGVLLPLCLAPVRAAVEIPVAVAPVIVAWAVLSVLARRWAIPGALAVAVGVVIVSEPLQAGATGALPVLTGVVPSFPPTALLGLALPLWVVTMASQNVPGMGVLAANGFRPAVRPVLAATGGATIAGAPFGAFAVNLAAITAALTAGPDAHPEPERRWIAAVASGATYVVLGLGAGLATALVTSAPPGLIEAVAGLALLGALAASLAAALDAVDHREAAVVTFVVSASSVTALGLSAAFWGLLAGLTFLGLQRVAR